MKTPYYAEVVFAYAILRNSAHIPVLKCVPITRFHHENNVFISSKDIDVHYCVACTPKLGVDVFYGQIEALTKLTEIYTELLKNKSHSVMSYSTIVNLLKFYNSKLNCLRYDARAKEIVGQ